MTYFQGRNQPIRWFYLAKVTLEILPVEPFISWKYFSLKLFIQHHIYSAFIIVTHYMYFIQLLFFILYECFIHLKKLNSFELSTTN